MSEMKGYDFSFSGIKTSVLYFLQKERKTILILQRKI